MNQRNSRLLKIFLVYDVVIIIVSFLGSIYLKYGSFGAGRYFVVLPLIVLIWVFIRLSFTSQTFYFRERLIKRIRKQTIDFMIFVGVVSTVMLVLDLKLYSRLVLFGTILFFFLLRNIGFAVIYKYLSYMRAKGRHQHRVLIIGAGRIGKKVLGYLNRNESMGYSVVGFLDDFPDMVMVSKEMILGDLSMLDVTIKSMNVQEVILAIPLHATEKINKAIDLTEFHGLRISLIPDYHRLFDRPFETTRLGPLPIIKIREIALDKALNKTMKRVFDIVFSASVLLLLSPVYLVVGLMVKLSSRGPILYRPIRIGLEGKEFECWKFRSMKVDDSPDHAQKSTVTNDPRITKLGAFLRRTSLDELPQFANVFFGDMSVVGPRPHRAFLNEDMQQKVDKYMLRHYIKPGITGWAQVNGWRGPTDTQEQKSQRTSHDLWYIENWTYLLDIKIIFMTLKGGSKNAY